MLEHVIFSLAEVKYKYTADTVVHGYIVFTVPYVCD